MSDIPRFTMELAASAIERISSFGITLLFTLAINAPSKLAAPCRAGSIYYSILKTHDITEKNIMLIIIRQIWEMIKIPVMDLSQPTAIKSTVLSSPRIKKKRETSSSK